MNRPIIVIGAGAAGLATAIFAKRHHPGQSICLLDGAKAPGAKILVSGGGRCNVTNTSVEASDFSGGRPGAIRQILRAWPASATVDFFHDLGVPLHEEECGKLFPDSNRARDVIEALLREVDRLGVELRTACRVNSVTAGADGFAVGTSTGPLVASAVVLATGGLSLPKTGSDGAGYELAQRLGHTLVATTPALVPLVADRAAPQQFHAQVSGVSQPVRLTIHASGTASTRVEGPMLWTHFGVSGPAGLDASRHWLRHRLEGQAPALTADLTPGQTFESLEARWLGLTARQPRLAVSKALIPLVPASVAGAIAEHLGLGRETLSTVTRPDRRRLLRALSAWPIAVQDSRGYNFAEVTAGGVPLGEIDPRTMESRVCPGLYCVGEMLDVDGRLGGFNFQWAWSTGKVASAAVGTRRG